MVKKMRNQETDPNGLAPHTPGAKLDSGKVQASMLADFGLALAAVAQVGEFGLHKYSRSGWLSVPDGEGRYRDALWRHMLAEGISEIDADSGLRHLAHAAWNALAVLELHLRKEKIARRSQEEALKNYVGKVTDALNKLQIDTNRPTTEDYFEDVKEYWRPIK